MFRETKIEADILNLQYRSDFYIVKKIKSTIVYLLVCVLLPTLVFPQILKFKHLSVENGLSQANIWDIHQDKFGFMWIATEDGLNLYDGYTFKVFENNPSDSTTISNNFIYSIAEDKNGDLWLGTRNGVSHYDRKQDNFESFFHNPGDKESLSNDQAFYIFCDSRNNIWVGTPRGLNLFNTSTKKFKRFINNPSDSTSIIHNNITSLIESSSGELWITTRGGLSKLNKDGKTFTNYLHDPDSPASISSNLTTKIFEDSKKNLWVGTLDNGLNLMKKDGSFVHFKHDPDDPTSISSQMVQDIREDVHKQLWLATEGGINVMDPKTYTFGHHVHYVENEKGLTSNSVSSILFDKDESMWVGTRSGGINVFMKDAHSFKHFKQLSNANSLSDNNVTCFAEDDKGNFWIAVDGGGLNYYDRKSNTFTYLKHERNNSNSLSNDKALSVKIDRKGGLWIGYWAGGLDYYDPKTKVFKHYKSKANDSTTLSGNSIFSIYEDSKGNIWVGTWGNGINRYNRATDDFTRYPHNPEKAGSFVMSTVVYMIEDHEGTIWIGDEELGLGRLDPATGEIDYYFPGLDPLSPSPETVYSVFEDSKHRLWVGTNGRGLNLFDRKSKTFKAYTTREGLPNETILGILEDNDGNLWLSTFKGLSNFNPETSTFRNYYYNDGLQSNQFNRWAFLKLSTGEMLFGGINGFNMFDPADIKSNSIKPPVYITDFELLNKTAQIGKKEVLKESILFAKEITLDYWQNFFSFEYTALNYRQSEKNQYKYKLEGLQKDWIDAGTERKASYTNLSPGVYTFRIIASNNDGVWNEEGASLKITIKPPYWQTIWFKLGLIAAVPGLFFSWFYYRINTERKQKKELEGKVQVRTSEVLALNNELLLKEEWLTETQRIAKIGSWEYNIATNSILWSDEISKILGLDEIQGTLTIAHFLDLLLPEDREKTAQAIHDAIHFGKSYEVEMRHILPNGSIRWVLAIGKPHMNEKGEVVKLRGIAYDINERKKAEISLRKSEEFFKALIQKSSDYVLTSDEDGKIIYESPTIVRLTGYLPIERHRKHVTDLVCKEDRAIADANLKEVITNPSVSKTFEVRINKKDGEQIWVECTITNLLNHPEVEALVINTREITERKISEEQLKNQNEELKKINGELDGFVYRASHDLRAPLSSILGLIGIAKGEKDEEMRQQYFQLMQKSVDKLDLFIKNIIDYSRNSRLKIVVKAIDFEELIEEAFDELKYMNRSEEIERSISLEVVDTFFSDPFRLKIIFNNLISNAIRYSNQNVKSFINIKIKTTKKSAEIIIEDNGIGIAEESISKIFEMFYRASEQNVGSGLGLYIVKEAIIALKGDVQVESKLGKGTSFRIIIPNMDNSNR